MNNDDVYDDKDYYNYDEYWYFIYILVNRTRITYRSVKLKDEKT